MRSTNMMRSFLLLYFDRCLLEVFLLWLLPRYLLLLLQFALNQVFQALVLRKLANVIKHDVPQIHSLSVIVEVIAEAKIRDLISLNLWVQVFPQSFLPVLLPPIWTTSVLDWASS